MVNTAEREALWYTSTDLSEIRKQEQDQKCDKSVVGSNVLNQNTRTKFIRALLEQQTEHKEMGMVDAKGLFQLSRASSKISRQFALQVGRAQENEVKQFSNTSEKENLLSIIQGALDILDEL